MNDKLELQSIVKRIGIGECPNCLNSKLVYCMRSTTIGYLSSNGMASKTSELPIRGFVVCPTCGYESAAIQLGLKVIPVDRIVETDKNWETKYIEENTIIWGEKGKNPFNKG